MRLGAGGSCVSTTFPKQNKFTQHIRRQICQIPTLNSDHFQTSSSHKNLSMIPFLTSVCFWNFGHPGAGLGSRILWFSEVAFVSRNHHPKIVYQKDTPQASYCTTRDQAQLLCSFCTTKFRDQQVAVARFSHFLM